MSKKIFLSVDVIKTTGLQMRAQINMEAVREYAEAEREHGAVFPPLSVFKDKAGNYWLADGFHRLAAAKQNGRKKVCCEVQDGEFIDALKFAMMANASHGLRRNGEDKKHAVMVAYENRKKLGLPDIPSARLIAELVGVSDPFASNQLLTVSSWRDATERTGADGRTRALPPPPTRRPVPGAVATVEERADYETETPPPPVRRFEARLAPDGSVGKINPAPPVPSRKATPPDLPKDARGQSVPPGLAEIWNRRGEVGALAAMVSKVRCALKDAQAGNDALFGELNFSSTLAHLDMAFKELTAAEPWCVCPFCHGLEGCKACKGRGVMGEYRFGQVATKEMKA